MPMFLTVAGVAAISGLLSGLVGIGGGIVMAPLLLYVPQYLGLTPIPMKTVAGLTIIQSLVACLAAGLWHSKFNFVSTRLTLYMGVTIFIAAAMGGSLSNYVSNDFLLAIFAGLALIAALLMFFPPGIDPDYPQAEDIAFSRVRAVSAASGVGVLGGLVGQGGSFILIPLMTAYVRIPTRVAIGTNLAIVTLSSVAAFIGKAATGQIVWKLALPIVLAVVPAASLGSRISRNTSVRKLRLILALVIAGAAFRIVYGLFQGSGQ